MELTDLAEIVEKSTQSAFRLESLPLYDVPHEAEAVAAWRAGQRPPLDTPETSPWLAQLKARTDSGYRWYRARILDYPLTSYAEWELHGYQANQAAGEEIHVADRRWHRCLESLREDFWIVDDETVIRMIYDDLGRFVRPELADDIAPYLVKRSLALRHCVPLGDYLARREPRLIA